MTASDYIKDDKDDFGGELNYLVYLFVCLSGFSQITFKYYVAIQYSCNGFINSKRNWQLFILIWSEAATRVVL